MQHGGTSVSKSLRVPLCYPQGGMLVIGTFRTRGTVSQFREQLPTVLPIYTAGTGGLQSSFVRNIFSSCFREHFGLFSSWRLTLNGWWFKGLAPGANLGGWMGYIYWLIKTSMIFFLTDRQNNGTHTFTNQNSHGKLNIPYHIHFKIFGVFLSETPQK